MRISDIVHGLRPLDVLPFEVEDVDLIELDIDLYTVRSLDARGTTKKFHLWDGDEGSLDLAEAVLPAHTRRWYKEQVELIDQALGNYDFKRDALLIQAIQRSFGKSDDDRESDEERVARII